MRTIWKYELEVTDVQTLWLPRGAEILKLPTQNETPCVWVLVDSEEQKKDPVEIFTYGTGHPCLSDSRKYLGTYQLKDGALVFHAFL